MLGRGHLGVVLLPSIEDSFEQAHLNFYGGLRKRTNDTSIANRHSKIEMLVFGGSKFAEREPNLDEFGDMCILLRIEPEADSYELEYLPGAKLRCPDKFFGNMQTRVDSNLNTVTVIGNKAAHRINTGKRNVSHLRWKLHKP